ncbi:MAG: hypothetical protein L0227_10125, partial [Chloroflexi bacterium]|nr:hypothetical protein [Chloroflexota bacterium]
MPTRRPFAAVIAASVVAIALVAAGCGAPSPSPVSSPTPPDGSTEPAAGFRLRLTTVQALPPLEVFTWTPQIVI